jgi:hypothetical protein
MTIHVSGTVRVLFERHELEVPGDPPVKVPAFRCRWCDFTVVTDESSGLPDHACDGPAAREAYRNVPPPPYSHAPT